MSSGGENESEILLGNKQLLAIFFVIAFLLFVAFTGGYMIGRGNLEKKPLVAAAPVTDNQPKESGLETHPVGPGSGSEEAAPAAKPDTRQAAKSNTEADHSDDQDVPLGTPKQKNKGRAAAKQSQPEATPVSSVSEDYAPQSGQMFLQVVALARDDAYGVTEVLAKKGFRAHAVPKPGNGKLYRVLIGPIRDTADLSATRDALRKTGFQDVILQRY
jgi:cell division septation protein DedD